MKLSIIILNYKSKGLTRECVRRILDLKLPIEHEIIVVDNGSRDGVGDMLNERFGDRVRFIGLPKNVGMGAGNNAGFKVATGEHLMVLNPDAVMQENTVEPLMTFLESHPQAGIVAPKILNPDLTHQTSVHRFPHFFMPAFRRTILGRTKYGKAYLEHYVQGGGAGNEPSKVDWVFGPAFIIRKSIVEQLGGYDERYFLFFEDTDLCRQVWDAGHEVWYVPEATLIHFPHRLSGHHLGLWSLGKKTTWHHIVSWLKYFWKWRRKP